jgi:hypothetical protein
MEPLSQPSAANPGNGAHVKLTNNIIAASQAIPHFPRMPIFPRIILPAFTY